MYVYMYTYMLYIYIYVVRGQSRPKLLPFSGCGPKITSAQILKNMSLVSRSFKRFCVEHCFKFLENQSFITIFFV